MNITTKKDVFNETKKEITEATDNEIKGKVIRNSRVARQILAKGGKDVWLFDVKPDREHRERTCFVFEDTEKFQNVMREVIEDNRKSRETAGEQKLRNELDELKKKFEELAKMTESVNTAEKE